MIDEGEEEILEALDGFLAFPCLVISFRSPLPFLCADSPDSAGESVILTRSSAPLPE